MAGIQLYQPGGVGTVNAAGASHPAPVTVDAGLLCYLSLVGATTPVYSWSITRPAGSSTVISSVTSASPSFNPDIDGGAYSVTLVDQALNTYVLDIVLPTAPTVPAVSFGSVVTTLASLRVNGTITGVNSYSVMCYATIGDGGGGLFDYDSADVTSADDNGCIIVAGTRRYKRRIVGERISVRWFGATATTTNGSDGTNDVAAFNSASTYAAANSAEVFIPGGKYRLATTWTNGASVIAQFNAVTLYMSGTPNIDVSTATNAILSWNRANLRNLATGANSGCIRGTGTPQVTPSTFGGTTNAGATGVKLGTTAGLTAGDYVFIYETGVPSALSELNKIASITNSTDLVLAFGEECVRDWELLGRAREKR